MLWRGVESEAHCASTGVIDRLKEEFLLGYREGWRNFWSPFTGLWRALQDSWRTHVGSKKP